MGSEGGFWGSVVGQAVTSRGLVIRGARIEFSSMRMTRLWGSAKGESVIRGRARESIAISVEISMDM